MDDKKDFDAIIPNLNDPSNFIPKLQKNVENSSRSSVRKPLKRRGAIDDKEDIPLYEPVMSPLTKIDETVELPMLIENSIPEENIKPEVIVEETIELPLFKNELSIDVKEPIKTETKLKKNNKILKFAEFLAFVTVLVLTVFCAYKVINWHKENVLIDQEIDRIQSIVEERYIEPTDPGISPIEDEPTESNGTSSIDHTIGEVISNDYREYVHEEIPTTDSGIDKLPFIDVDIESLKAINPDTKAYIKINNLDINAPVVETTDNSYYLSHSFDRKYTSAGWIFGDYRNDWDNLNDNTIIYGHNRRNYAMFGSLKKMYNKEWYEVEDNHYIYISTETKNMIFEIFSVYDIPTETYYLTNNFRSKQEYQTFLDTLVSRSTLDFTAKPTSKDKILTLSTCSTNGKKTVVHARLLKSQKK